jgi:hypothetical protein
MIMPCDSIPIPPEQLDFELVDRSTATREVCRVALTLGFAASLGATASSCARAHNHRSNRSRVIRPWCAAGMAGSDRIAVHGAPILRQDGCEHHPVSVAIAGSIERPSVTESWRCCARAPATAACGTSARGLGSSRNRAGRSLRRRRSRCRRAADVSLSRCRAK